MKPILTYIQKEVAQAFQAEHIDAEFAMVSHSNRPDLCQYQSNGALAAAKKYKKAPIMIAEAVAEQLSKNPMFSMVEAVKPGFINLTLSSSYLAEFLNTMAREDNFGFEKTKEPKKVIIDYGGPNVAKPLHVGHLRPAIIGESIKRISRFVGDEVIGDVHLGDWGLPMGLIITELKKRKPELPYFQKDYKGEYPEKALFTIAELEEIYPYASAYAKEHKEYMEEAHKATYLLQQGNRGYLALWQHTLDVSIADLKRNYESLDVSFELWKKESDAQKYIPAMVEEMKEKGYAYLSEGALVVDVKEETDTKEIPPCMILKSDGATLYNTTDLATIVERMKLFSPDAIVYVVDKRQELYFEQIFRCAKKTGLVNKDTKLTFLGFGTMNGKDGKPFKTRSGGVMRLEHLIHEINEAVYKKIMENRSMSEDEARNVAKLVGLAALKYGDLSNQASKDYVFDIDRFTSFEGETGPYLLYTIVRIKSILAKYKEIEKESKEQKILSAYSQSETDLSLVLVRFHEMILAAYKENAPHKVCQYLYDLSNAFNKFYHENKIIGEAEKEKQSSWIALITLTLQILNCCISLLGIKAPDRM